MSDWLIVSYYESIQTLLGENARCSARFRPLLKTLMLSWLSCFWELPNSQNWFPADGESTCLVLYLGQAITSLSGTGTGKAGQGWGAERGCLLLLHRIERTLASCWINGVKIWCREAHRWLESKIGSLCPSVHQRELVTTPASVMVVLHVRLGQTLLFCSLSFVFS